MRSIGNTGNTVLPGERLLSEERYLVMSFPHTLRFLFISSYIAYIQLYCVSKESGEKSTSKHQKPTRLLRYYNEEEILQQLENCDVDETSSIGFVEEDNIFESLNSIGDQESDKEILKGYSFHIYFMYLIWCVNAKSYVADFPLSNEEKRLQDISKVEISKIRKGDGSFPSRCGFLTVKEFQNWLSNVFLKQSKKAQHQSVSHNFICIDGRIFCALCDLKSAAHLAVSFRSSQGMKEDCFTVEGLLPTDRRMLSTRLAKHVLTSNIHKCCVEIKELHEKSELTVHNCNVMMIICSR